MNPSCPQDLQASQHLPHLAVVAEKTGKDVDKAYRLVLGRRPTARETELAEAFLRTSPPHELIRALFNLNAFVYAE